jgi:hypothetical protein
MLLNFYHWHRSLYLYQLTQDGSMTRRGSTCASDYDALVYKIFFIRCARKNSEGLCNKHWKRCNITIHAVYFFARN